MIDERMKITVGMKVVLNKEIAIVLAIAAAAAAATIAFLTVNVYLHSPSLLLSLSSA